MNCNYLVAFKDLFIFNSSPVGMKVHRIKVLQCSTAKYTPELVLKISFRKGLPLSTLILLFSFTRENSGVSYKKKRNFISSGDVVTESQVTKFTLLV